MNNKSGLKRVKGYIISMEEDKLLGRGRMGEVRLGIRQQDKKLMVFKITSLPISQKTKEIIEIQQKLNQECAQSIYPIACSLTKAYIPYQHLPSTLAKKWDEYKGKIDKIIELCSQLFYCYSYFLGLGLGHGNIKASNIGFTKQGKMKFMDILPYQCSEDTFKQDMTDFGQLLIQLSANSKPKHEFVEWLNQMVNNRITWMEVFDKFGLIARLTKLILEKNEQNVLKRTKILLKIASNLTQTQNQAYLACSIYIYLKNIIKLQIKIASKPYQKTLSQYLNKIQSITNSLPHRKYYGIIEAVKERSWFKIDLKTYLQIIMCLLPWVNHQYIEECLVLEASEGQLEVIAQQYLSMIEIEKIHVE